MKFTVTLFLLLPALLIGKQDRPNFVIFLTDDMGWGDLACYGHPRNQNSQPRQVCQAGDEVHSGLFGMWRLFTLPLCHPHRPYSIP